MRLKRKTRIGHSRAGGFGAGCTAFLSAKEKKKKRRHVRDRLGGMIGP
jgi:hypothetical protein